MPPSLSDRIRQSILDSGPLPVDRYIELCLNDPDDGYYARRPNLGEFGDFITAPLVSQMFGELLGLWVVEVWRRLGSPDCVRLVELGPGLGVMMSDMLRAASVRQDFRQACQIWLVETSSVLRVRQMSALAGNPEVRWAKRLEDIPAGDPTIVVANEFLDCLPIRQAVRDLDGWRERCIGTRPQGGFEFVSGEIVAPPHAPEAPPGAIFEWSPAMTGAAGVMADIVMRDRGAALMIDYGWDGPALGDTLQAVSGHNKRHPLEHPGQADLTAHVDFPNVLAAARAAGARVTRIRDQGDFLEDLGISARAARLATIHPERQPQILRQHERLTGIHEMGRLFKVAAIASGDLSLPALELVQ